MSENLTSKESMKAAIELLKGPIDRNNRDDLLIQIGYVKRGIEELNRKISEFDKELNRWERRKDHINTRKDSLKNQISKKHKYINQLESNLNTKG